MRSQTIARRSNLLAGARLALALGAAVQLFSAPAAARPGDAGLWVTTADGRKLLERQPDAPVRPEASGALPTLTLRSGQHFQTIDGFGAALTDASALLIARMPPAARTRLLRELFGHGPGELGLDVLRVTIGASDFSTSHYTYDDPPDGKPDPALRSFSIAPARVAVIPVLKQIRAINPGLRIFASPWSAPAWMKTTGSLIGGTLRPEYMPAFAEYLRRYAAAMAQAGVRIDALTVQNEPNFEPTSYPGMRLDAAQRATLIGRYLGPALAQKGPKLELYDWDHNWDHPESPLAVLNDPVARRYVTGIAWHCYDGSVSAQTPVHDAFPDKTAYITECSGGDWMKGWGAILDWQMANLVIGGTANWARGVVLWNLALDPDHGPHDGGCSDCRGVVTIAPSGTIERNVEYYALGHASRFLRRGAVRIGMAGAVPGVDAVAFRNTDGTNVVLLLNGAADERRFAIADGRDTTAVTLAPGEVATLVLAGKGAGRR
jgi:glucosylceramidase